MIVRMLQCCAPRLNGQPMLFVHQDIFSRSNWYCPDAISRIQKKKKQCYRYQLFSLRICKVTRALLNTIQQRRKKGCEDQYQIRRLDPLRLYWNVKIGKLSRLARPEKFLLFHPPLKKSVNRLVRVLIFLSLVRRIILSSAFLLWPPL